MFRDVKIEPVPQASRREAMRFVAAGGAGGSLAEARAQALDRLVRDGTGGSAGMWWARRRRRCLAAAIVMERPGRTGMLFRCDVDAPGVDAEALAAVVRRVSEEAMDGGLAMVQAFVRLNERQDVPMLSAAGYVFLAELVYMQLELMTDTENTDTRHAAAWTVRNYDQFDQTQLASLIAATYVGSRDCPSLCGVRELPDVLASHRASGGFRPEFWWVFDSGRTTAGCILVNAATSADDGVEVVYTGVRPEFRGRGLGAAMLQHAVRQTARQGAVEMKLAVDNGNNYAKDIYRREGFEETDRRLAYVMVRGAKNHVKVDNL